MKMKMGLCLLFLWIVIFCVVLAGGAVVTGDDDSPADSLPLILAHDGSTISTKVDSNTVVFYPNVRVLSPENNTIFIKSPETNIAIVELYFNPYDIPPVGNPELYHTCFDIYLNDEKKAANSLGCFDSHQRYVNFQISLIGRYELVVTLTYLSNQSRRHIFAYSKQSIIFEVLEGSLDLSRLTFIEQASIEDLRNRDFLEFDLLPRLGFNGECLHEQPAVVQQHGGGLLIWQYPNQFAPYLVLIQSLHPTSYLELGCRWGGTFILTVEYLQRFAPLQAAIAVDVINSTVQTYPGGSFHRMNSTQPEFKALLAEHPMDMIFIDGDHTYEGVKADFLACEPYGRILVFHDIVNYACLGVAQFWYELKLQYREQYDFYEFVDQYPEVVASLQQLFLGIGVAVRKDATTPRLLSE